MLGSSENIYLQCENPRYSYAFILNYILKSSYNKEEFKHYKNGSFTGENVIIGEGTQLEPFVFIGSNTVIGRNCLIKTGAKIGSNVKIGNNTVIRENSIIGFYGFGVETEQTGETIKIPHIGGVVIGDDVEIGALNTVASGTILPTVIGNFTKTDDHVHIAHNCKIGNSVIITACAEISGSVTVKDFCYLGPNCSIINKVTLEENVFIGIGSVVLKNCVENSIYVGNPAKFLRSRI